jgi:hydrogenase nickel incorporation protein HypA/HybF
MHELALSEGIVRTALKAGGTDERRMMTIAVDVGALSAVNASSLEFCLRLTLDERGMEHTAIEVALVPAKVNCQCGHTYTTEDMFGGCPLCGGFLREIVDGRDVTIRHVEIEDEED